MRERLLRVRRDDGFSLLESVIALTIAAGIFGAMSVALLQTVRSSVQARQNQVATDVMNQQVEYVRSLDYSKATELTSDLAGDPNLTHTGGTYYLATSAGNEQVVAGNVGLLPQHIKPVTIQGTTYTVATYITKVTDSVNSASDYRRVVVIVTWSVYGQTHTRRTSTFIAPTRRGLALPVFNMGTAATYKTNVGAMLALPITITNVGAPDAYNLTATTPPSGGSWSWYYDSNGDGVYTSADAALTDSDGNGQKDTGLLQVSQSILVFAVRPVMSGEPTTQTVTFTAVSAAQPSASTGTKSFSDQLLVNPATCSGCTLTTYFLHNSTTYGDTVYQSTSGNNYAMTMDKNQPLASRQNLYNYATDCATVAAAADCGNVPYGRHILTGGVQAESNKAKVAAWYYSVPSATTLSGTGSITIAVQAANGSGSSGSITAYIGSDMNPSIGGGSFNAAGTATVSFAASSPATWTWVTIPVPISSLSINNNKYLGVRVTTTGALNIRVAYDTQTYTSQATLPITSGG